MTTYVVTLTAWTGTDQPNEDTYEVTATTETDAVKEARGAAAQRGQLAQAMRGRATVAVKQEA